MECLNESQTVGMFSDGQPSSSGDIPEETGMAAPNDSSEVTWHDINMNVCNSSCNILCETETLGSKIYCECYLATSKNVKK